MADVSRMSGTVETYDATFETSHATLHRNGGAPGETIPHEPGPEAEETDEWLSLNEAAAVAGVAKSTAWRAWRNGRLEGMERRGRILISRASARSLREESEPPNVSRNVAETKQTFASNVAQRSETFDRTPSTSVPFHAFQEVLNRLQRSERENVGMQLALHQHRLALEENACSIVEREARAKQAEARLVSAEDTRREILLATEATYIRRLEEEAAAREEAEARARALTEQLAQIEADRARPWWKRLMGG